MNLKKNIIYQFAYQVLILVIPLILSKYVTNIITKDTLGIYSYSYSIAGYFVTLGMLGIQKYGTRLIAKVRHNELELRKAFWSLYIFHVILAIASLIGYMVLIIASVSENRNIYLIQAIYVASVLFDLTWLFYGLENFKSVVLKNTLVKIFEISFIVLFVKGNEDLWAYTLIMSLSVFIGQIIMFPQAISIVKPIKIKAKDMLPHIKPMLILSISVLSTSVYAYLDKTILGLFSPGGKGDVAIYDYSEKIVKIPLSIITSVGTVMLPRMALLSSQQKQDEIKNYLKTSILWISMIAIGCMFGIASISRTFVSLWYGSDYSGCANGILYLSPIVFFISFGDIIRSQYLIPQGKDKEFTITVIAGAVINFVLNMLMIPRIGLNGAILSTVIAEAIICISQFYIVRGELPILRYMITPIPFMFIGMIMYFINSFIESAMGYSYITLLIQVIVGAVVYCFLAFLFMILTRAIDISKWRIRK